MPTARPESDRDTTRRIERVTSDAGPRPQEETPSAASASHTAAAPGATGTEAAPDQERRPRRRPRSAADGDGTAPGDPRPSLPLVPVLAVLLVLLLAGVGFLWFTRPGSSSVRTDDYVEILQAARSGVVDMTSFD